jgi:type III pantothenate kinase
MILALDVGNTNIVIGCISDEKIYFVGRLSTDIERTEEEHAITFKNIIEMYGVDISEIEGAIISSVVPPLINVLTDAVTKITGKEPLVVGPGVKTGLNILMDNPAQLGSDQVVDAIAALAQYKPPLIILDMGTATTISVVDKDANYTGGLIVPGVKLAVEALSGRTSQLPFISLEAPKRLIGKNTIDCMKSGMIYGTAAMIDGVVERIEETLGQKATVVATGGLGEIVTPFCKKDIIYDDNLLLKGLLLIYNKNKKGL